MKPKTTGVPRAQKSKSFQGEGPNWVLIVGGALLSTLSIRLGYKLKQALDTKQGNASDVGGKSLDRRKSSGCHMQANVYSFTEDDGSCFNCLSGWHGRLMRLLVARFGKLHLCSLFGTNENIRALKE
ncbi:hypothetical protein FNV43_RR17677 [Rhamnella rubrinervis]|uniref:Uncharacterized protein n=1 Tax=Rhamnella rubrinervis TaxID=2594499 RepID=A0A8K0E4N8_9ROSA|nr:hypothetical protein FNV43_RR17677 [Rhamnella rubrinervis]